MARRLPPPEADALLAALPDWRRDPAREAIRREFVFADFAQAFAFMTRIALAAEKLDHHPEWSNVWNRVDVTLTTHDCGGLSQLDFDLARIADAAHAALNGGAPCNAS